MDNDDGNILVGLNGDEWSILYDNNGNILVGLNGYELGWMWDNISILVGLNG